MLTFICFHTFFFCEGTKVDQHTLQQYLDDFEKVAQTRKECRLLLRKADLGVLNQKEQDEMKQIEILGDELVQAFELRKLTAMEALLALGPVVHFPRKDGSLPGAGSGPECFTNGSGRDGCL